MAEMQSSLDHLCQLFLVKADDDLCAFASDRAAQQIRFGLNQLEQFVAFGQRFAKFALFVNGVTRIEKGRRVFVTENGFEFRQGQRLFGVIAFDQIGAGKFAQETPGVTAGRSSGFAPEIDGLL